MFLKRVRWISACLLAATALLASPAQSKADITILIEEIDSGGNTVGTGTLFNGSFVNGHSTTNFTQIQVGVSSNSAFNSPTASISTGFSYLNVNSISPESSGVGLRITVTDSFDRPPGGDPATVNTTVGASTGSTGLIGLNTISNQTTVLDTSNNSLGSTAAASVVSPTGAATGPQSASIAALPPTGSQFQLRQTIQLMVTSDGNTPVPAGQTYGGTAASSTQPLNPPDAVPAPAGLVLALTGLPVLGLYRAYRRKKVVPVQG